MSLTQKIELVLTRVYGVRPRRGEFEMGPPGANEMAKFLAESIHRDFEVQPRRVRASA